MCGIAGVVTADPHGAGLDQIGAMTRKLAHRGPDGEGFARWPGMAFGHRRLAIIDRAGGRQPMESVCGRYTITFNGEIYNHTALRAILEADGCAFRTRSDTEVVLQAYARWGSACVDHLRGMFAFAIRDHRTGNLLLARDPLGIKPLVYHSAPGLFAFASEIQGLRPLAIPAWEPDPVALDQFLTLGYIPSPRTAFRAVRKLPPGHTIEVGSDGSVSEPRRYWRPTFREEPDRPAPDDAEVEECLRESVRAHLVADVPFGVLLSGGIDSTVVALLMADLLGDGVQAFTIGFPGGQGDESAAASAIARTLGIRHEVRMAVPGALAALPQIIRNHGEPFGDGSAAPSFLLAALAREFVPMVLSGDGGDEAFAGYRSHRAAAEAAGLLGGSREPLRFLRRIFRPDQDAAAAWIARKSCIPVSVRSRLWRSEVQGCMGESTEELLARVRPDPAQEHPVSRAQRLDAELYLPGDVLAKMDIAGMAHGLEVRTPMVDREVYEFAGRIPPANLFGRRAEGTVVQKQPLRRILARRLPGISFGAKQGFAAPLEVWLGPGAALRPSVLARLSAPDAPLGSLVSPAAISAHAPELDGRALWMLLALDEWCLHLGE